MSIGAENRTDKAVTVIMPAYNASSYIEEAIRSVMTQTYPHWNLLVIDDGSRDETCAIVLRLAEEDARISLIRNEKNQGVAKTRNRGLDLCQGDYVALLDCDDWWHPQKLEKQLALADETGADILYCSYGIMDEHGDRLCDDFIVPFETDYKLSMAQSVISCSTALLSEEVVNNYRFRTDFYHEDLVLWLQLLRDGYQARGAVDVLAKYRVSQGSRASNKYKSAIERWKVFREGMNESLFASAAALLRYALLSIRKYRKV